jgi:putative hydrolase of the HAD superfamily
MALKVVFFDAAGTLIDARQPIGESYARIARPYGVDASTDAVAAGFRRAFHNAGGLAFGPGRAPAELRIMERDWWRAVVRESFRGLGVFTDFDAYFNELFQFFGDPANWRADPEAAPLLRSLKRAGVEIGLISNFDYRVYAILDGLGLAGFFDSVTISSEAGWAKPAPELFNAALAHHRATPGQSAHVGDAPHLDVAGATAAGLAAILIEPGVPERVAVNGRIARVASLAAIPEALEKMPFP